MYDRNGVPLAATREMVRVATAPREIAEPEAVAEALAGGAAVCDRSGVRRAMDRSRRWVVIAGRFDPVVQASLEHLNGVYLERVLERFHPHAELGLEVLGLTSLEGHGLSGLELELDSLLSGEDGYAVIRRDAHGDAIPGALIPVKEPRAGHDVYLTLDLGLQEIAEEALRSALAEHDAEGGDLIFADPRTGEVLAAASRPAGRQPALAGRDGPVRAGVDHEAVHHGGAAGSATVPRSPTPCSPRTATTERVARDDPRRARVWLADGRRGAAVLVEHRDGEAFGPAPARRSSTARCVTSVSALPPASATRRSRGAG